MLTEVRAELTFESGRRHAIVCKVVEGAVPDAMESMNLAVELYLDDHPDGPKAFTDDSGSSAGNLAQSLSEAQKRPFECP